jgi:O-acetylhomoserine (thiol)-lyase
MKERRNINQTNVLHDSYEPDAITGATTVPPVLSTSFAYTTAEDLSSVFANKAPGFIYSRINNPTVLRLEKVIANLENGIGAVACASGMAAITCTILALVKNGETILSSSSLFGGTYSLFVNTFKRLGIQVKFFDPTLPAMIEEMMDETVRVIFTETIGNPKMDVAYIDEIVKVAHQYSLPVIVDNTVTTPYLFRGIDHGVDLVVHSTSKYIDGQGRVIGGCIVDLGTSNWNTERYDQLADYQKQMGSLALLALIRLELLTNLGCCISPANAAIQLSGIETLVLRVKHHCANASGLAQFLTQHSEVIKVHYPGLKNDPGHHIANRLFNGRFGGLLTFEVESQEAAFKVINRLKLAQNLANLGDAKTLVIHPASTIYLHYTPEERLFMGVTDGLIRVSVGLETLDDIIEDFNDALEGIKS